MILVIVVACFLKFDFYQVLYLYNNILMYIYCNKFIFIYIYHVFTIIHIYMYPYVCM